MRIATTLCSGICAALFVFSVAYAEDTASLAREIRKSERMLDAAIKTGDAGELSRQRIALMKLVGRIREAADRDQPAGMSCALAAATLHNIALNPAPGSARALVAWEDDQKEYSRQMAACERDVRRQAKPAR